MFLALVTSGNLKLKDHCVGDLVVFPGFEKAMNEIVNLKLTERQGQDDPFVFQSCLLPPLGLQPGLCKHPLGYNVSRCRL